MTLEDCYQKSLVHIESVAIQEEEIHAAEGRYWQAIGTALPHISARGTEFIQDTSSAPASGETIGSSFLRQTKPEVALHLKQPIFQGFREFKSISGSSADRQRVKFDTERKGQLLFLEVAEVFLTVRQLENDLEILESQKKVMTDRTKELRGRVRLGKSRRSEILTTESQAANLEAEIARIRGSLAITRETLSFITGIRQDQK
ncbi:MAG: TolC family protein, partial [Deltaproteobacteria bacterium]|nr:TolC family protein [Deltaproteobacteria bacterium]